MGPDHGDVFGSGPDGIIGKQAESGHAAHGEVRDAASTMKDDAGETIDRQKAAGADRISRLGSAVHAAADGLGGEMPQAARYIHSAADSLQSASSSLRKQNIEELIATFNNFARRQPAASFATSLLAGFALSRFLKSSGSGAEKRD